MSFSQSISPTNPNREIMKSQIFSCGDLKTRALRINKKIHEKHFPSAKNIYDSKRSSIIHNGGLYFVTNRLQNREFLTVQPL